MEFDAAHPAAARARERCNARAFFPAELFIQSHVHERIRIVNDVIFSIPGSHEHPMSRCTGMQANAILCARGRAQICGFVVAPEWNGTYGTLLRQRADSKWLVHIVGREKPGCLWPANLLPLSDPPAVAPGTAPEVARTEGGYAQLKGRGWMPIGSADSRFDSASSPS